MAITFQIHIFTSCQLGNITRTILFRFALDLTELDDSKTNI